MVVYDVTLEKVGPQWLDYGPVLPGLDGAEVCVMLALTSAPPRLL